ncbi:MAG: hypothetical protein AB203_01770 [Parcubacteria bacterium C7867-008]|nr:MAG: hypothetical protein AB203_01770 [Parcubacteria bacterium C7867-008]
MEKKDKLNLDLDFLEKDAPAASPEKAAAKKKDEPSTSFDDEPMSDNAKWIAGAVFVGAIIIIGAWIGTSGNNSGSDALTGATPAIEAPTAVADTTEAPAELPKPSVADPEPEPEPVYTAPEPTTKSNYEICQERHGSYATYDSTDNSCGCMSGYYTSDTTNQCVSLLEARNDSCSAEWANSSFLRYDEEGTSICDCKAGYSWNNDRTACYSQTSYNQSCQASFGSGSYSTTENGKRVCDCSYGYDFNIARNACVTTASINQTCERDVGRNSRYAGYVEDGAYICTAPY